jgi:hypothetical protein
MRRYSSRQSKTFSVKRRTRTILSIVADVLVAVLIVVISSLLSSWSVFTLTNVQVSGVGQDEATAINNIAMRAISGKYLGAFSRANLFIYPKTHIKQLIKQTYPDIETVDVARAGLHTLTVIIHDKIPSALVCATLPDFNGNDLSLEDPGACYFTDVTGLIFKKAPSFSGTMYNRYYIPDLASNTDDASSTTLVGQYATSTDEFNRIQRVYSVVNQNDIIVDAIFIKGGGEYELYVRNPDMSSSTVVVYFNTISSTTEQLSNLISFWNHSVDVARTKNERLEFDYIDVRYSPNVYHRFAR